MKDIKIEVSIPAEEVTQKILGIFKENRDNFFPHIGFDKSGFYVDISASLENFDGDPEPAHMHDRVGLNVRLQDVFRSFSDNLDSPIEDFQLDLLVEARKALVESLTIVDAALKAHGKE